MSTRPHPLAAETARGFVWATLATLAGKALSVAALMVLARVLVPTEFGVFGIALVYLVYLETIGDLGMGAALMYWPSRHEDAAKVSFVLGVAMGLLLAILTFFAAPAVSAFFQQPDAVPILRALGLSFLIKGFGNTHDALLKKALRFKARLVPELGLASLKALIGIGLAVAGHGVWSLVWAHLLGLTAWAVLLWQVVPWRPTLHWPADLLRPMLAYSIGIVAVNLVAAITHHADLLVVGRMLGATALGFYQMAYRLPEIIVSLLVWQASRVLFPAFARVRAEGGDIVRAYLVALRWLSMVVVPASVALCVLAEPLVLMFFGDQWRAAVPIMRALALYAGIRALGSPAGDVLKASGRSGLLALLGVLKAAILLPVLVLAATTSAVGVAAGMGVVSVLTLALNLAMICRLERIALVTIWRALRESVHVAAVVGLVLAVWVANGSSSAVVLVSGGALLGSGAYLASLRVLSPDVLARVATLLLRRPDSMPRAVMAPVESPS